LEHVDYEPVRPFPPTDVPKSISTAAAAEEWMHWTTGLPVALRTDALHSCHTVHVPNGFADAAGNVFTEQGFLVVGASMPYRRDGSAYRAPNRVKPAVYRGDVIAVLTSAAQHNYCHWLTDVLPRLHMLRTQQFHSAKLYVAASTRFQRETLSVLGVADQVVNCHEYTAASGARLIVPFHEVKPRCEYPAWVPAFLRNAFLPIAAEAPRNGRPNRLYISRADVDWRRVVNEGEVMELLEPLGFKKILPGQLSFMDQVRLFANAEAIVAPHGAALTNLVFAPRGAVVVEFQPWKLQDIFFRLSRSVGLDYYYLKSSTGPSEPISNRQQIHVDLDRLRQTLSLALLS
jgi:capsular polysaccharide biosynthesis protein